MWGERLARRPYDAEIGESIIACIRDGATLRRACQLVGQKIDCRDIWHWCKDDPEGFGAEYSRARLHQADMFADDVINLADNLDDNVLLAQQRAAALIDPTDFEDPRDYEREVRKAEFFAKRRSIESTKMSIDARKWAASKLHPKHWGERTSLEVSQPEKPAKRLDFSNLSTEQLEKLAELSEELAANGSA